MPPYKAVFSEGSRVFIANLAELEKFRDTWKHHNPLELSQLAFAGKAATVKSVGFYFGGDVLYWLEEIPGTWNEQCLRAPEPRDESIINSQLAFDDLTMEVSQPEKCIDCENRLGGEDHGRNWQMCKFCGEAVCDSCEITHYCEKQRSMKPNNLR